MNHAADDRSDAAHDHGASTTDLERESGDDGRGHAGSERVRAANHEDDVFTSTIIDGVGEGFVKEGAAQYAGVELYMQKEVLQTIFMMV